MEMERDREVWSECELIVFGQVNRIQLCLWKFRTKRGLFMFENFLFYSYAKWKEKTLKCVNVLHFQGEKEGEIKDS